MEVARRWLMLCPERRDKDGEVGKFFQARYRAVRLLDETAILACAAYVDLNPIRAAIADTIEDSEFTSAQKREAGLRREFSVTSVPFSEISSDGDESRVGGTGNTGAASEPRDWQRSAARWARG